MQKWPVPSGGQHFVLNSDQRSSVLPNATSHRGGTTSQFHQPGQESYSFHGGGASGSGGSMRPPVPLPTMFSVSDWFCKLANLLSKIVETFFEELTIKHLDHWALPIQVWFTLKFRNMMYQLDQFLGNVHLPTPKTLNFTLQAKQRDKFQS